jgi:hypothetical protein
MRFFTITLTCTALAPALRVYFADLHNWRAAGPYVMRAKELFEAGDRRSALYARLGVADADGYKTMTDWLVLLQAGGAKNAAIRNASCSRALNRIVRGR